MKMEFAKSVGGTSLWPVQFGITPNCGGARPTGFWHQLTENVRQRSVSGATPETTGATPVPPDLL
jgi:hypothetical protein